MHVLIIPSSVFVTEQQPLNGIFQLHQARLLASAGYKVGVLSVGFITPRYIFSKYNYLKFEKIDNFTAYREYKKLLVPWRYLTQKTISYYIVSLAKRVFERYISEQGKPDVVHVHNFLHAGLVGEYIQEKYGIPFFVTEHSSRYENSQLSLDEIELVKRLANKSKLITAVSSSFSRALSTAVGKEVKVLPNVIDQKFITFPELKVTYNKAENFVFFNAASLDSNKNHSILLKAFQKSFKGKQALLRIAGEGPLLKDLLDETRNLGISSQVEFLNRLTHEEIRQEMGQCDCFVLTSNYETFGVVLIEAMSCGVPVIASDCGGPADIVNPDVGFLFEPRCEAALSDCMEKMFKEFHLFNKNSISSYAIERFGPSAFLDRYKILINMCLMANVLY